MDFCGLIIQPEDLGLQAPYLKKIHSVHTLHLKASLGHGISEQSNRVFLIINFNKLNKINTKIKCLFRHITSLSSSYKKHTVSSFHELLSWKQFFPPHSTCIRTICLWGADHFTDFHTWFIYNVFKLFLEQHWHLSYTVLFLFYYGYCLYTWKASNCIHFSYSFARLIEQHWSVLVR